MRSTHLETWPGRRLSQEFRQTPPSIVHAQLGCEGRRSPQRRRALRFIAPARIAVLGLDVVGATFFCRVTWQKTACHWYKPTTIIPFDQALMASNASCVRRTVFCDGEVATNWVSEKESKRMSALLEVVVHDLKTKRVLIMRPIITLKGKHAALQQGRQYGAILDVVMHPKAVVESDLLRCFTLPSFRRQSQGYRRCFVFDCAMQHVIHTMKASMNTNRDFYTQVEEGTACWFQLAD